MTAQLPEPASPPQPTAPAAATPAAAPATATPVAAAPVAAPTPAAAPCPPGALREEHGGWERRGAPPGTTPAAATGPAGPRPAPAPKRRLDSIPAPLFCVAAMVVVQTGIALSTPLFPVVGVSGTTSLRLLTAAAALLALTRPRLRGRSPRALGAAAALGLASAGMTLLFAVAVDRLPMGTAATVEFLGPLAVALLFSRQLAHVLWALLAAGGVVLLTLVHTGSGAADTPSGAHGSLDPTGLACAFGAAACLAGYILLTRRVGRLFQGFDGLALSLTVAALVMAPVGLPSAVRGVAHAAHPWLPLLEAAGVAVLFPLLPYVLEMVALRRLPERVFSVIASLEPGVSALVGLVVLGQRLGLPQLGGMACVIAASAAATLTGAP